MSAFCGYEQEDERVKANYDFPQINLIIILLLCSLWGWQEKKGQGLSIYHRRNMKTEHNNGANTQGFNCYLDSPKKHLIKSFHTSRISQQQTGKRKSCFLQAVKLLCDKCWWICQLLWQVLAGIIYVIFLRLVLTNIWQEKLRLYTFTSSLLLWADWIGDVKSFGRRCQAEVCLCMTGCSPVHIELVWTTTTMC